MKTTQKAVALAVLAAFQIGFAATVAQASEPPAPLLQYAKRPPQKEPPRPGQKEPPRGGKHPGYKEPPHK